MDDRKLAPMRGRTQPPRADVVDVPRVHVLDHPLVDVLMTSVRDVRTGASDFAEAIQELTRFLLWPALTETRTSRVDVPGHTGAMVAGYAIAERIAFVAILRAGLGMLDPIRSLLPESPIYQIGVRRDEATLEPHVYYTNLPTSIQEIDHLIILDPMLATGGSAAAATAILRRAGLRAQLSFLGIIGAPTGVKRLLDDDPGIQIHLAALDDHLDDRGYIIPGLGDAGDRLFGTL